MTMVWESTYKVNKILVKWVVQGRVSEKRVKNCLEIGCPKNK